MEFQNERVVVEKPKRRLFDFAIWIVVLVIVIFLGNFIYRNGGKDYANKFLYYVTGLNGYEGDMTKINFTELCAKKSGKVEEIGGGWGTTLVCVSEIRLTSDGGKTCEVLNSNCHCMCIGFFSDLEISGHPDLGRCSTGKTLFTAKEK